jgi:hypothetical protein
VRDVLISNYSHDWFLQAKPQSPLGHRKRHFSLRFGDCTHF